MAYTEIMRPVFDPKSADTTTLVNELNVINSRIEEMKAEYADLQDRRARIYARLDLLLGNPGKSTEEIVHEVEANLKRSASRIIRDRKKQGEAKRTLGRQQEIGRFSLRTNTSYPPSQLLSSGISMLKSTPHTAQVRREANGVVKGNSAEVDRLDSM